VQLKLKDLYRDTSRPSIDPELPFRKLSIGYLYGVTGEAKLLEASHGSGMALVHRGASIRRFRTTGSAEKGLARERAQESP
jgi:transposase